ncbi:MAG: HigA family addiction module antitoxin [Methylocella sp.]
MTDAPLSTGMMPSHPGAIVREEILVPLNLTVSKAAKALGVRRATLSDLLNEKAALSPEMALRIELAFGVSMEMMLRIQTAWDIATTRQRESALHVTRYQPEERPS